MLPFIAWTLFSTIYYGFPFPNTAYAKLSTGFPLLNYLERGFQYSFLSLLHDPIVVVIPLIYIAYSVIKKDMKHIMISLGITFYLAYIIYIGGDFMAGRYFSLLFFISVFCMFDILKSSMIEINKRNITYVKPVAIILAFCLTAQFIGFTNNFFRTFQIAFHNQTCVDEREFYFSYTSILHRYAHSYNNNLPVDGAEVVRWEHILQDIADIKSDGKKGDIIEFAPGILVYYCAKDLYINDTIALGDPLLACLPAIHTNTWRTGHMRRAIPEGYRETVQSGVNKIVDPSLHEYYDVLCKITQSKDLFTPDRLKAIINMNLGKYEYLINEYISNIK